MVSIPPRCHGEPVSALGLAIQVQVLAMRCGPRSAFDFGAFFLTRPRRGGAALPRRGVWILLPQAQLSAAWAHPHRSRRTVNSARMKVPPLSHHV
jgi:hypothetical protein